MTTRNVVGLMKLKSYILNRFANRNRNYHHWMSNGPLECEVVEAYPPTWEVPSDAGIVITHMHYRWEEVSALRRIFETTSVPILILADGVIEYRNTWENPTVADGAMFQPLVGHKLACIGRSQARVVESWGNEGRCEVVGIPGFDDGLSSEHLPVQSDGDFRLLIVTANQPGFTPEQRTKVVASLRLLKQRFENNGFVNQRPVKLVWRLTDGLENDIGVSSGADPDGWRLSLSDEIEMSDAVITTPSTVYLESVLKRRPTAVLDFTNSPAYVPSAWTISAPVHLNDVLRELENPPAAKMQFQRSVLFDQVELGSCARTRLYSLIETMVAAGVGARRSGNSIRLPSRILDPPAAGTDRSGHEYDAISLYPHNPTFEVDAIGRLRQELNLAVIRLGQLPAELNQKEDYLQDAKVQVQEVLDREQTQAETLSQRVEDIERKNEHIKTLNQLAQEARRTVVSLRAQIAHKDNRIASLNAIVAETLKEITEVGLKLDQHSKPTEIASEDGLGIIHSTVKKVA